MIASMILCAGLGTRLRPLSVWCAKPLVPVGDRPALAHVLDRLEAAGVRRHVINTHHRGQDLEVFAAGRAGVHLSDEPQLLGTAGGLAHASALLGDGDVLVHNGDILADLDVASLLAAHAARSAEVRATLAVCVIGAPGSGNVGLDSAGEIVRLRRETVRKGETAGAEFTGVHVLGAVLRRALPASGCLVGNVYLPALRRGERLAGFRFDGSFADIGSVASYHAANLAWLAREARSSWQGAAASVAATVSLEASIVGRGAVIEGKGALVRVVAWPGARAVAPLADCIVTPHGTVSARGAGAIEVPR